MKTNRLSRGLQVFILAWAVLAPGSAHAFDLTDTAGARHKLADFKGKWVVVNFWATWCAPCIKEIPEIAEFSHERRADVVVLGIALDVEDEAKTKQFAAKIGHAYPLVLGEDKVEKQFAKVRGLPTTLIYDPTGKKIYDRMGVVTRKFLSESTPGPRKSLTPIAADKSADGRR